MSTNPVVAVVTDTTDLYPWVLTRRAHHPNCVGIQMGVADRQAMSMVGDAVLAGLGHDPWLSISKRPAELLAGSWLSLGETTDALIGYTQLISDWLVPDMLDWFAESNVRPWLIYSHFGNEALIRNAAAKRAADLGVDVIEADELRDAWADTDATPQLEPASSPSGLPVLPRVDGFRFRSKCRAVLDDDQFNLVDEAFTTEVAQLRDELAALVPKHLSRQYSRIVRRRLADARDTEELVLRARAAQVAGLTTLGLHVTVDTTVLIGAAQSLPRPGLAEPQGWWEQLDRYRDPDPGAVAALYSAGVDPDVMPSITVGDVTRGEVVKVTAAGEQHEVSGGGARFLNALVEFRLLSGAASGDPLLSTHRARDVRPQFVSKMLWSLGNNTGVAVAPSPATRKHPNSVTWLARYGIKISKARNVKVNR